MTLLLTLAKATFGILVLFLGWVTVERAWRRAFGVSDEARNAAGGCGGCGCMRRCEGEAAGGQGRRQGHEQGQRQGVGRGAWV